MKSMVQDVLPGRTAAPHVPCASEVGGGIEKGGGSGVGNKGNHGIPYPENGIIKRMI